MESELCVYEKFGFEKIWELKSEFENIFKKVLELSSGKYIYKI